MKKTFFNLAIATTLMAGTIFTGCQSLSQKKENVDEKVADVNQDLTDMKNAVSDDEWNTFKSATEVRIHDNELRIAALKLKMKTSGKTLDAVRAKRIETLEQQNRDLRARYEGYNQSLNDWAAFKAQFNHDMDELAKALDDLGTDSK